MSVGFFSTTFLNKTLEDLYNNRKSQLESKIENLLGKNVELGEYSGIRLLGISVSNLKIIDNLDSNSFIEAEKVYVGIKPALSFLNQRWIVNIKPKNAKINITKDFFNGTRAQNDLRIFEKNQIKYDLNFNIGEYTNLKLKDIGLESKIIGRLIYKSSSNQIIGKLKAKFLDRGDLRLKFNTILNKDLLKLEILSNGINLRGKNYKVQNRQFNFEKGKFKSDFKFYSSPENKFCKGSFSLNKLKINTSNLDEKINSDSIRFLCNKTNILAKNINLNYGTLFSNFTLNIPLNKNINNINLEGNIGFLDRIVDPDIKLSAIIPYWYDKRGLNFGNISSDFNLNRILLSNLNIFKNKGISGYVTASGAITGNLLNPDLLIDFNVDYPQYKGIKIKEIWEGEINNKNNGYLIKLNNRYSPIPSFITLNFDSSIELKKIIFSRISNLNKGNLNIFKNEDEFVWEANNFPLDELQLSLGNDKFDRLSGNINGSGSISSGQPNYYGRFAWSLGEYRNIKFANSIFSFDIEDGEYYIDSSLYPIDGGIIDIKYDSSEEKFFNLNFDNISLKWSLLTAFDILDFNNNKIELKPNSRKLNNIEINNKNKSFEEKISFIKNFNEENISPEDKFNLKKYLNKFDGRYNADLNIFGTDQSNLKLEADVDGDITINEKNSKNKKENFSFSLKGELNSGNGILKIRELPLKAINIFLDKSIDLNGSFGFDLYYKLKEKYFVTNKINTYSASINDNKFNFEKGFIEYKKEIISTDLSLKYTNSDYPTTLKGSLPLKEEFKEKDYVELKISGDKNFIKIIDYLSEDLFDFRKGDVYFSASFFGTVKKPTIKGRFNIINSEIDFLETSLTNVNSKIFFNGHKVEIEEFTAEGKNSGSLEISGNLPFYEINNKDKPISFIAKNLNIVSTNFNSILYTNLNITGTFFSPSLGGDIALSNGFYNFKNLNIKNDKNEKDWEESEWNRVDKIEIISDESPLSIVEIRKLIPNYLKNISFNNLKLKLGPAFRLEYLNTGILLRANFDTRPPGVDLKINGKIKEDKNKDNEKIENENKENEISCGPLTAEGRINLFNGRANLFTMPFKLNEYNDNHLLFASRNCLVPFVNFSFNSKVPESIIPINENNKDNNISADLSTNDNSKEFGSVGIGNTRIIKINASYQGFLDELRSEENIFLRSTPSYSRSQIIGLIGGNSANLINRAFISQINSSDGFSERFQLSLYPALIENNEPINNVFSTENLEADDTDKSSSNDGMSTQAWIAEIGLDITDRVNFAVQATPDRDDLPPLGILTLQANPNLELLGSMDSEGEWKSQVQLFFRY